MARDPDVIFFGEDVAAAGGVFKATVGLYEKFGPKRVRDTPISEQAIMGAVMGAAMTGLKPIAEIMFSDFFAVWLRLHRERVSEELLHERTGSSNARWWCAPAIGAGSCASGRSTARAWRTGA